jgi:hypothetical protein
VGGDAFWWGGGATADRERSPRSRTPTGHPSGPDARIGADGPDALAVSFPVVDLYATWTTWHVVLREGQWELVRVDDALPG